MQILLEPQYFPAGEQDLTVPLGKAITMGGSWTITDNAGRLTAMIPAPNRLPYFSPITMVPITPGAATALAVADVATSQSQGSR
jgi:hypothetical protein